MNYAASNLWMPMFTAQLDFQRRYFEFWRDMTQAMVLPMRSARRDLVPTMEQAATCYITRARWRWNKQGGWLRPWQKGQSGNPGGFGGPGSTYHEARKLCAQHTPEAIHKQIELMRTCDDPRVVTIVTQAIIDRGAGKPRDHSNEQTQRVDTSVLTPEKREALAALLREVMGLQ